MMTLTYAGSSKLSRTGVGYGALMDPTTGKLSLTSSVGWGGYGTARYNIKSGRVTSVDSPRELDSIEGNFWVS